MSTHTPGWGASLHGDSIDLGAWGRALSKPFDPWVEIVERGRGAAGGGEVDSIATIAIIVLPHTTLAGPSRGAPGLG